MIRQLAMAVGITLVANCANARPAQSQPGPRLFEPTELDADIGSELRKRVPDVVLLAPRRSVVIRNGVVTLRNTMGTNLCLRQRFASQRGVGQVCSGVLVAKGLILTAAHCLVDRPIGDWMAVVGHDRDIKTPLRAVAISGIRHCIPDNEHGDLVALELAEPIEPSTQARFGSPTADDRVHLLGHPFGLSLKASTCAVENRSCDTPPRATQIGVDWFLADLDGFKGNSGSPVYSSDGRSLIGIWSSAPTTLVLKRSSGHSDDCYVYPARPTVFWGGKVTRVDRFAFSQAPDKSPLTSCTSAVAQSLAGENAHGN